MDISSPAYRQTFSNWLRTGWWIDAEDSADLESKYNPWHDPDDGRFTFANSGRYFGGHNNDSRSSDGERHSGRKRPCPRANPPPGGFGGAGVSGDWPGPKRIGDCHKKPQSSAKLQQATKVRAQERPKRSVLPVTGNRPFRSVFKNGYQYEIDGLGRTRRISGEINFGEKSKRSRKAQREAGKPDRRSSDDGGHYIAARFNGPTEAFNHFAQNKNFNRGSYRLLEDQWARAKRSGKKVDVTIVPIYEGSSLRPSFIDVWFHNGNKLHSLKFRNEPREKARAEKRH